jgi:hypothetical protein
VISLDVHHVDTQAEAEEAQPERGGDGDPFHVP